MQAFVLNTSNIKILLFNVYFPNLPVSTDVDYDVNLNVICGFILQCIDNYTVDGMPICVCGDFNVKRSIIDVDEWLLCLRVLLVFAIYIQSQNRYTGDIKYT